MDFEGAHLWSVPISLAEKLTAIRKTKTTTLEKQKIKNKQKDRK